MEGNDLLFTKYTDQDSQLLLMLEKKEALEEYDPMILACLEQKNQVIAENYLTELCFRLLDIPEEDHLFTFRIYFTGLISEVIRRFTLKGRLQAQHLTNSSAIISTIESWTTIAEFLSSIPWFVRKVIEYIMGELSLVDYSPITGKILNLINENLEGNHLSLRWLSLTLGISPSHLCNNFKADMDETLSTFINRRKIQESCFDIKHTDMTLKEIADKFGYGSQSYYIHTFKKFMDITPLKYKRNYYVEANKI
ncbi:helix-turn-helix transcriptional regulator [Halalkalibacillus halophilus]|uniref:helix-turn-helix transcriptional regulator n=1 Tax=Halalkalibacillus halophilus TaxID=392827 RepID=UPI000404F3F3|nr:helix-turn-helix transcriptional regulator [Halalkalibacillus halophilus]